MYLTGRAGRELPRGTNSDRSIEPQRVLRECVSWDLSYPVLGITTIKIPVFALGYVRVRAEIKS